MQKEIERERVATPSLFAGTPCALCEVDGTSACGISLILLVLPSLSQLVSQLLVLGVVSAVVPNALAVRVDRVVFLHEPAFAVQLNLCLWECAEIDVRSPKRSWLIFLKAPAAEEATKVAARKTPTRAVLSNALALGSSEGTRPGSWRDTYSLTSSSVLVWAAFKRNAGSSIFGSTFATIIGLDLLVDLRLDLS